MPSTCAYTLRQVTAQVMTAMYLLSCTSLSNQNNLNISLKIVMKHPKFYKLWKKLSAALVWSSLATEELSSRAGEVLSCGQLSTQDTFTNLTMLIFTDTQLWHQNQYPLFTITCFRVWLCNIQCHRGLAKGFPVCMSPSPSSLICWLHMSTHNMHKCFKSALISATPSITLTCFL